MPKTTETISITLRPATIRALDDAARAARRSRSQFVDLTLEHALTGRERHDDAHQADAVEKRRSA